MKSFKTKYVIPGISIMGLESPNPFSRPDHLKELRKTIWVSYNGCGIGNVETLEEGEEKLIEYASQCLHSNIKELEHKLAIAKDSIRVIECSLKPLSKFRRIDETPDSKSVSRRKSVRSK